MDFLPFALLVAVTVGSSITSKLVINNLPRLKALLWRYVFCFLFVLGFWLVFDGDFFSVQDFLLIALGLALLNFVGVQCEWAAYKINMSRTSLFYPMVSVGATVLFCIFLQEYRYLNILMVLGFCLHLLAIWLFKIGQLKGKPKEQKVGNYSAWLWLTLGMVVANILIQFAMKVFSSHVTETHFLLLWYAGTLFYFSVAFSYQKGEPVESSKKNVWFLVPVLSLFTVLGLLCLYWLFQDYSGIATVSFVALNTTFIPVVVGWLFFGEAKNISRLEIAGFICGIVAAILIISTH